MAPPAEAHGRLLTRRGQCKRVGTIPSTCGAAEGAGGALAALAGLGGKGRPTLPWATAAAVVGPGGREVG